ncbi:MAG: cytochrome c [Hyphomicrobiales bacterium]
MMRLIIVSLCLATFAFTNAAFASDIKLGKKKARMCNVCHGKNGIATNPEAPNLAGESAVYIEKQLFAFRGGEREHRQMSIIAKGLKDDDIKNLSAWYAAMKVTVELPDLGE